MLFGANSLAGTSCNDIIYLSLGYEGGTIVVYKQTLFHCIGFFSRRSWFSSDFPLLSGDHLARPFMYRRMIHTKVTHTAYYTA